MLKNSERLTTKYKGKVLLLKGSEAAMEAMRITAPIQDGILSFNFKAEAAMAEYLVDRLGREALLRSITRSELKVRARVISVGNNAILAAVRVADCSGSLNPELDDPT